MYRRQSLRSDRCLFVALALLILLAITSSGHGARLGQAEFLADLRAIPDEDSYTQSYPSEFTEFNGFVFFRARDPLHGEELWRTDGSEDNTELWADICPGPCDSTPQSLTLVGDKLFFFADDGVHGRELWQADGSGEGTRMALDLYRGPNSGATSFITPFNGGMIVPGPRWTDGNPENTFLLGEPGSVWECVAIGDLVYLSAFIPTVPGVGQGELFASHGEPGDLYLVKDIFPPGSPGSPLALTRCGERVCFFVGRHLWSSDGTEAGTFPIFEEYLLSAHHGQYTRIGDVVLFSTPVHGQPRVADLMKTDGRVEGTSVIVTLPKDPDGVHSPEEITEVDGGAVFKFAAEGDWYRLWRTDLTADGTYPISDRFVPYALTSFREGLFFFNEGMWYSNGHPEGASRIDDVYFSRLAETSMGAFFRGFIDEDVELWSSDGTASGTSMVKDIVPVVVDGSAPTDMTAIGNKTLFVSEEGPYSSNYLWLTDGTTEGTRQAALMGEGIRTRRPWTSILFGERLIFTGYDQESSDSSPFIYDPHTDSIEQLAEMTAYYDPEPREYTIAGDVVYFTATIDNYGRELWVTNGMPDRTFMVADLTPGNSGDARSLVASGNELFLTSPVSQGRGIWRLESWMSEPVLVVDPGTRYEADSIGVLGSKIIYQRRVRDGEYCDSGAGSCWQLLAFDPESGNSETLWSITPGDFRQERITESVVVGDSMVFALSDRYDQVALWATDGTDNGTGELQIRSEGQDPAVRGLTLFGRRVFFGADDGVHGHELWATDGSQEGTTLVQDFNTGPGSSLPEAITAIGKVLMLAAWDSETGLELVYGDGAEAWVREDLLRGPESSNPSGFSLAGGAIVFAASDPVRGSELWRIGFNGHPAVSLIFQSGFESGSTSDWSATVP